MGRSFKLLTAQSLRRSRLGILESLGLKLEGGECGGYYRPSGSLDEFPSSGDPIEDEKLRNYIISKQFDAEKSKIRRLKRIRKLARMDLRMVGGVSPNGAFGGAGGGDGVFRPASIMHRL